MAIYRMADRCNLCMRCVSDCISGVWQIENEEPVAALPERCNLCSHCVAVCPTEAIVHDKLDPNQVRPIDKKRIDPNACRETVITRRSVRQYLKKPVRRGTVQNLIDLAGYSPTATNSQHVEYTVLTDPARLNKVSEEVFAIGRKIYDWAQTSPGRMVFGGLKLYPAMARLFEKYIDPMDDYIAQMDAGRDLILHNAPVLILIHAPARSFFGAANCNIAATNIMNYAHALGLGTCMIGFVTLASRFSKQLTQTIELPEGRKIHASLVLGHPKYDYTHTVSRKKPAVQWMSKK
ncbi:MAG: nitroreductase family protein [Desulfobacterales bacterium]